MAVNISPGQMNNEAFDQELIKLIDQIGLPGDALKLEVTELMMIQPRSHNARILNALTTKGIKLAMDDFGTGYSLE